MIVIAFDCECDRKFIVGVLNGTRFGRGLGVEICGCDICRTGDVSVVSSDRGEEPDRRR